MSRRRGPKVGDEVTIAGIPMTIVSDEALEAADVVVCGPADGKYPFQDNVTTTCAHCGMDIVHRPYAPKKPAKICFKCFLERSEATLQ